MGHIDMISSNVYKKIGSEPNQKLPKYTSLGCYPIIYITTQGNVMCADCAYTTSDQVSDGDVHWEGESHFCEECNCEIHSAYGIPSTN
jgi:hypothetical protein